MRLVVQTQDQEWRRMGEEKPKTEETDKSKRSSSQRVPEAESPSSPASPSALPPRPPLPGSVLGDGASALCGLSCRRTREGGRAGRLGPSGRDGEHPPPPHRLQQTPILGPRHPTILVRGGTLKSIHPQFNIFKTEDKFDDIHKIGPSNC